MNGKNMDIQEIRSWVQLVFLVVGGLIGLIVFFQNMKQRKIENALKLTKWFHDSISEGEISSWKSLFHAASEPAGAPNGFYISEGGLRPLSDYFSEGSPDSGAVGRIADCLEVICHEVVRGTVDARFIWFEFGQLLSTTHGWLGAIDEPMENLTLLERAFPYSNRAFKKFGPKFKHWPSRTYAYVE